ncbi:MAG: hypothetical protein ACTSRX_04895, partial [Promethearchaeota archaeon]
LVIMLIFSPQIESLDIDTMTDAELFEEGLFLWGIILIILIFALAILGFIVLGMFIKYLIQLQKVSIKTSSIFLRNIFISEILRSMVWMTQLIFLGSESRIPSFILNSISAGISVYVITQLKKWVGYFGDFQLKPSEVIPLQSYLKIWLICIISFICLSFLQVFIDGLFLILLACGLLLLISVVLWFFGKKIIWLFV